VFLFSLTACGESPGENKNTATTTTEDAFKDEPPIETEMTITYLGCYNPTQAGDIRAAYNYFRENYNAEIKIDKIGDVQIMERLATLIASDDAPDLVDRRSNTFPYFIGMNMYEALDNYIDLNQPQWSAVRTYVEDMAIRGKQYYYPWTFYVGTNFLVYDRNIFEELAITDPYGLYMSNQWDWYAFEEIMSEFVTIQKTRGKTEVYGMYGKIGTSFINTTGKAMVSYENGKLINNTKTPQIERAQTFLEDLRRRQLSILLINDFSNVDEEPLKTGNAAFHAIGDWKITDYAKLQINEPEYDFFFVPFPRDPSADEYYFSLSMMGYLVPAGSKNIQLACDFMSCVRLSKTDPELKAESGKTIMKEKKYTEEQFKLWEYFTYTENFNSSQLIMDLTEAFDTSIMNDYVVHMTEDIAFDQSSEQMTWTSMRDSFAPVIDSEIKKMNDLITN
jgi:multiple sugar transport system substrate-binding protein